jgi:hypothetical protein
VYSFAISNLKSSHWRSGYPQPNYPCWLCQKTMRFSRYRCQNNWTATFSGFDDISFR